MQIIWEKLPQEHVAKAVVNFIKRLTACVAASSGQYEHLQQFCPSSSAVASLWDRTGDSLQGGDTRMLKNCGWIYKEQWTKRGRTCKKRSGVTHSRGDTRVKSNDNDDQKRLSVCWEKNGVRRWWLKWVVIFFRKNRGDTVSCRPGW